MLKCPACSQPLAPHDVGGVEIDLCSSCGGVFLESGEPEAQGTDTAALFGLGPGAATEAGTSNRLCPVHRRLMKRFQLDPGSGSIEIERAACCGGIFLDAGEGAAFADAARRAAWLMSGPPEGAAPAAPSAGAGAVIQTATGATFAAPPPIGGPKKSGGSLGTVVRRMVAARPVQWQATPELHPSQLLPSATTSRKCPRCQQAYRMDRGGGVEVDVCPDCGSMFLDLGETDARGIDTSALFSVGPEAAVELGVSELSCPACDQPMRALHVSTLAGVIEVDRASCCGGLFLDGGEYDPFVRAARRARSAVADRTFARDGQVVPEAEMIKAMAGGMAEIGANFVRGRVDSMMQRMVEQNRRHHRHGHHQHHDHDSYWSDD